MKNTIDTPQDIRILVGGRPAALARRCRVCASRPTNQILGAVGEAEGVGNTPGWKEYTLELEQVWDPAGSLDFFDLSDFTVEIRYGENRTETYIHCQWKQLEQITEGKTGRITQRILLSAAQRVWRGG